MQQTTQEQCLVTQHLTSEALPGPGRQKPVFGIPFVELRCRARILTVSRRGHDQSRKAFYVPPIFLELYGQPVEQLRVARHLTLITKILGGLYQTCAKKALP